MNASKSIDNYVTGVSESSQQSSSFKDEGYNINIKKRADYSARLIFISRIEGSIPATERPLHHAAHSAHATHTACCT
ncbi:hypothetical protein [Photorhabdus australis]|uniref:hypothetical protein n=1 Tax=Photorhabdus australis TaxID=286156 RepID=UPI0012FF4FFB|nr:hypothetical protein [Photorhabdus australis]